MPESGIMVERENNDDDEDCNYSMTDHSLTEDSVPLSNSHGLTPVPSVVETLGSSITRKNNASAIKNGIELHLQESSNTVNGVRDTQEPSDFIKGIPTGKDTGYAWIIIFLVLLVNAILCGNFKSFGITFTIIMDYFPEASGAATGWILGLLMGCRCLLSPVMGALTVIIGPKRCVILGGLICTGSFLLSVFAFSVEYMAFTLGAMFGVGMCMAETPGYIVATDYFDKRRSISNGLRSAGTSVGGFILSPIVVILHQQFAFQGAFIMMAGIMLQMVVLGMLMRPFDQHKKILENIYLRQQLEAGSENEVKMLIHERQIQKTKKKKPLDFTYFKNPCYWVYLIVVICSTSALPNALFYMPVYGKTIELTDMQNSVIASYVSLSDCIMRLACGWIFNFKVIKKTHGFTAGLLLGGTGCLILPLCNSMWQIFISATLFSICMGIFWTLINVLLADQFGGDSMPSTWGFFRMTQGICSFIYPPLIGLIMDMSGGVLVPYILMGALLYVAAAIFSLQPLIARLTGSNIVFT